jgi:hypothetical protein
MRLSPAIAPSAVIVNGAGRAPKGIAVVLDCPRHFPSRNRGFLTDMCVGRQKTSAFEFHWGGEKWGDSDRDQLRTPF